MNKLPRLTLASILTAALFLSACSSTTTGDSNLGGSFPKPVSPVLSLSTSSPSGNRSISVSDEAMIMDVTNTASVTTAIAVGSTLTFTFVATAAEDPYLSVIDPLAAGKKVNVKNAAGTTVGTGTISVSSDGTATAVVTTTIRVAANATSPEKLTLNLSTADLLAEHSGADDDLTITAAYKTTTVTGNTVHY